VALASNVGFKADGAPKDIGVSRAAIPRAINLSLARLQVPIEESLEAMGEAVRQQGVLCGELELHGWPRISGSICFAAHLQFAGARH
jgi:aryl-alcohol dehydrogenase-like predicted oxidoreductase